jgi:hypothetical protein
MHLLHAPALLREFRGQPIEQLGIGWRIALASEVAWRADDAAAEVPGPEPIHHNAGGERMLRLREPLGQRTPPLRHKARARRIVDIVHAA